MTYFLGCGIIESSGVKHMIFLTKRIIIGWLWGYPVVIGSSGYPTVNIGGRVMAAHLVVWDTFCGPRRGRQVHHKDGNRFNWSLDNLMLVTEETHRRLHNRG